MGKLANLVIRLQRQKAEADNAIAADMAEAFDLPGCKVIKYKVKDGVETGILEFQGNRYRFTMGNGEKELSEVPNKRKKRPSP